jgi:endonuclease G, mitochondrial
VKISSRTVIAALDRAAKLPDGIPPPARFDYARDRSRDTRPAAVARRAAFLSLGGARPSETELERLMGTDDLVDEFYLERALIAAQPVCRISIRSPSGHERGCATGFMISPRLLLTNEHVFGSADEAEPSIAEFNYRLDIAGRPDPSYQFRLRPELFFFNNEPLDFAVVAVDSISVDAGVPLSRFGYHRLIAESGKGLIKEWMTIIQHPAGARRQFAIRENQCVEDRDPDVIWYMSDTAQGSSGAPVLNDSFQVVALHHSGVARQDDQKNYILKDGRKVTSLIDVDDAEVDWIANAGVRISRICACIGAEATEKNGFLTELKSAMEGGDVLSNAYRQPPGNNAVASRFGGSDPGKLPLGTLVLELNTALGVGPSLLPFISGAPALAPSSDEAEGLKEPIIDNDYSSRKGFDPEFLGMSTPLPTVTNELLIAPTRNGNKVIPYEHFSIVLHKERKLAIFSAANVDGSAKARRPEAGKDYTRDGLTGLNKNQQEKWVLDPRVDPKFQIPDQFYNRDKGAFDKGHIVRREDVCFGESYAQVRRANGDTFHLTNCSPQRASFNRAPGIWGDLENFIGAQSDTERLCVFAAPILAAGDKTFPGTEDVKLPSRFWKIVCAVKNGKLQVFAFVLEQDVKDLPLEFQVDAEWKHRQVALKKLESMIALVKFPKLYHDADQA